MQYDHALAGDQLAFLVQELGGWVSMENTFADDAFAAAQADAALAQGFDSALLQNAFGWLTSVSAAGQALGNARLDGVLTWTNSIAGELQTLADGFIDNAVAEVNAGADALQTFAGSQGNSLLNWAAANGATGLMNIGGGTGGTNGTGGGVVAFGQAAGNQPGGPGGGGFFNSIGSSLWSMCQTGYAIGQYVTGNSAGANQTLLDAYANGPLGQAERIGPGTYAATAGSLAVATAAAASAGILIVAEPFIAVAAEEAAAGGAAVLGGDGAALVEGTSTALYEAATTPQTLAEVVAEMEETREAIFAAAEAGNTELGWTLAKDLDKLMVQFRNLLPIVTN